MSLTSRYTSSDSRLDSRLDSSRDSKRDISHTNHIPKSSIKKRSLREVYKILSNNEQTLLDNKDRQEILKKKTN